MDDISDTYRPTYNDLYEQWKISPYSRPSSVETIELLLKYIKNEIQTKCSHQKAVDDTALRAKISSVCYSLQTRWKASSQNCSRFERKNKNWLETELLVFSSGIYLHLISRYIGMLIES